MTTNIQQQCYYNSDNPCINPSSRTQFQCLSCVLKQANDLHPYREYGHHNTDSPYNEGWCDALNFISAYLHIDF